MKYPEKQWIIWQYYSALHSLHSRRMFNSVDTYFCIVWLTTAWYTLSRYTLFMLRVFVTVSCFCLFFINVTNLCVNYNETFCYFSWFFMNFQISSKVTSIFAAYLCWSYGVARVSNFLLLIDQFTVQIFTFDSTEKIYPFFYDTNSFF